MTLASLLAHPETPLREVPRELKTPATVQSLVDEGMAQVRQDLVRAKRLAALAQRLAKSLRDSHAIGLSARLRGHTELLAGRPKQAIPHYQAAREAFRDEPLERAATAVAMLQALAYVGAYDESLRVANEALATFEEAGDAFRAARIRANLANTLHRQDRLAEATDEYRTAMETLATHQATADIAIVARNFGVCLMSQGRFAEAAEMYAQASQVFEQAGDTSLVLELELNRAYMWGRQGLIRRALVGYRALRENLPADLGFELGHSFLDQADIMLDAGLWTDARLAAARAREIFTKLDVSFEIGKATLLECFATVRAGDPTEAARLLTDAKRRLLREPNANWHALAHQAAAEIAVARRQPRLAFGQLKKAEELAPTGERLPAIREQLADLAIDLGDTTEVVRLSPTAALQAKHLRALGKAEDAEQAARQALAEYDRTRIVLGNARLRKAAAVAQEKSLRECFRALRTPQERLQVVSRLKNQALAEVVLSPEALADESQLRKMRSQLYSGHSESDLDEALRDAQNTGTESEDITNVSLVIPGGTRFLELFADAGELIAFVVEPETVREVRLGDVREFEDLARRLRLHFAPGVRNQPQRAEHILATLRERLAPLFEFDGTLVVGRSAPLFGMPIHAVFPQASIIYAPSAVLWSALGLRTPRGTEVVVTGAADELAPHIEAELQWVTKQLGTARTAPDDLAAQVPGARLVHIAAHGIVREDRPLFSSMRLGAQSLSVFDIVQWRMSAELVVLSGCSTGLSPVGDLREAEGFLEVLFAAGAQSVVASLWEVSDEVTRFWMERFYTGLGEGTVAAYRSANEATRAQYPHPADWAAFALFGRPSQN